MTESNASANSSSFITSSLRAAPSSQSSDPTSIRPRNRRLISTGDGSAASTAHENPNPNVQSTASQGTSRTSNPWRLDRPQSSSQRAAADTGNIGQFLGESWNSGWATVSGLANSILSGHDNNQNNLGWSGVSPRSTARSRATSSSATRTARSWGPAPPSTQPGLGDVAAGSRAERESALRAARTASVLESHDGVNGGLDVSGRHKRRNSDDVAPTPTEPEDFLVYVHRVQPVDTYAGLILRYRCREDAFRRANGLWSRDSLQTRKWLTIPVDACEVRGRPCDAPSWHNSQGVDLLAPTPNAVDEAKGADASQQDFFSRPANGGVVAAQESEAEAEERPWTHVRWVKIDTLQEPVEIGRVMRGSIGYFPPRRRKSIRSVSAFSTPRQSLDLSSAAPGSVGGISSRRQSSLGSRPHISSTPVSARSRIGSDAADARPAWMRRPGGVGSMGKTVRAPGPKNDVFNTWTKKHIPALNIESLPSMSIMGSETANFGFSSDGNGIVENSFEEGRDATAMSRQGSGLDKAAAAVETWLRGALSKRPSTPLLGPRSRIGGLLGTGEDNDLIELTDTASDDGKPPGESTGGLLEPISLGSSARVDGTGFVRGRISTTVSKDKKAD